MISCSGPKQRPAKDGKAKMKAALVLVAIARASCGRGSSSSRELAELEKRQRVAR
jgi:hypothetical protein